MSRNYTADIQKSINNYHSDKGNPVDFLKAPDSFITFDLGLIELLRRKGYAGNLENKYEMSDYLAQKLNCIHSTIKKETVDSWFFGQHRPKIEAGYRRQIYEICFALHLTYDETVWFFQHVYYDRAFNCHTIDEAVFYYAFLNNLTYMESLSIIDEINTSACTNTIENNNSPNNYTQFVQNCIANLHSTKDLKEFLISNKSNFDTWNRSALNKLNCLIGELLASEASKKEIDNLKKMISRNKIKGNKITLNTYDQCGLLMKEILFDAEKDSGSTASYILETISGRNILKHTFILDRLLSTISGIPKSGNSLPYVVRNNFPSKKIMSDVLSEDKITRSKSYDSIRKMIVLLNFYSFWVRVKIGLTDISGYSIDERYEIYVDEADTMLFECGYESLYAGNPYDWIFLCSAKDSEPLDFFRSCISGLLPDL